jgi:hypothetical protein
MSLRKMCAVLAVLSMLTMLLGAWALVTAEHAADGNPAKLEALSAADLKDGRPVTVKSNKVLPYVCYIADSESDESVHRYRYYPVQYNSNPARFALVCVASEDFREFEGYCGKEGVEVSLEGYLRAQEPRTQAAIEELAEVMSGLDEESDQDYRDRFLTFYVEKATLRSSSLQRGIGWILLIGGMLMGAVGVAGFIAFRIDENEE